MSIRADIVSAASDEIYHVKTRATGPVGKLPLTSEMLLNRPSGDIFGLTQDAGMGWNPAELGRKEFLILSTQGGLRAPDGQPRPTDRSRLSYRPLGNRSAGGSGSARIAEAWRDSIRGILLGPV
jgi:hypothetical protein